MPAAEASPGPGSEHVGDRHVLFVEGRDAPDALLRLLGVVAVQQAHVLQVGFDCAEGRFHARLELDGLGLHRARHLSHRLAQLPIVSSVSLAPDAQAAAQIGTR